MVWRRRGRDGGVGEDGGAVELLVRVVASVGGVGSSSSERGQGSDEETTGAWPSACCSGELAAHQIGKDLAGLRQGRLTRPAHLRGDKSVGGEVRD